MQYTCMLVLCKTSPITVKMRSNMIGFFVIFFGGLHTLCCLTGKENVTTLHETKLTKKVFGPLIIQLVYSLSFTRQQIA